MASGSDLNSNLFPRDNNQIKNKISTINQLSNNNISQYTLFSD